MAFKEWFQRLRPVQLYVVLFFTTAFFVIALVASHVSHSLTLLINAYHMLCNIIAMIGCLATIKYGNRERCPDDKTISFASSQDCVSRNSVDDSVKSASESQSDRRMKNTFGWARIDVLTMLVCCVFVASFSFSLLVEALQTLIHIDHMDEMHHPLTVMFVGFGGILLNAFCCLLIGGYTFRLSSFLYVTENGDIIMKRNQSSKSEIGADQTATLPRSNYFNGMALRQGMAEMCRDVLGCVFVILVSIIVIYTDKDLAKFVDPIVSIVSAISLLLLSYPYMKKSGMILLQTIPNHINIDSLKKDLLDAFPGIVNIHDLHVWQLTGAKVISTAHIIYLDPTVYATITDQVTNYFAEMGISQVTIQPEFQKMEPNMLPPDCLIRCRSEQCRESQCCSKAESDECRSEIPRNESIIDPSEDHGTQPTDIRIDSHESGATSVSADANPKTLPSDVAESLKCTVFIEARDDADVKTNESTENEESCA